MGVATLEESNILYLAPECSSLGWIDYEAMRGAFIQARNRTVRSVIVDLSAIGAIDSIGWSALVMGQIILGPHRRICLCGLSTPSSKSLRQFQLDQVFPVYPDLETAASDLRPKASAPAGH